MAASAFAELRRDKSAPRAGALNGRRTMRTIVIILLSLAGLHAADLSAPLLTDEWSIRSDLMVDHPMPVQFVSTLARDRLAQTPVWPQGSESPPLSPRKAEGIALAMLRQIAGERRWMQPDISLRAFDVEKGSSGHRDIRWIYVLQFKLLGVMDFEGGSLNIIVLMDGTAIEPQKLAYKSIERFDYPGLGQTNYSAMYAFPWEQQLNLYQQQGWSIDSVTYITNKMGKGAVIRLQRLEKLEQKGPPNTAPGPSQ